MPKVDYYHPWNIINLSCFTIGWILIMYAFLESQGYLEITIGILLCILTSISIYYQNKLERNL